MLGKCYSSSQYISTFAHLIWLIDRVASSLLGIGNATCELGIVNGGQALFCVNVGLTEIEGFPDTVKYINRLHMGENSITNLPTGVFDVLNFLQILDLQYNQINNIEKGAFDSLGNLYVLNLMKNRLTSLEIEVFDKLANIIEIRLNNNYLSHLELGLFDSTPTLRNLWMHKIQLENLTVGIFDSLSWLTKLDMSNNLFTHLPEGIFDSLASLQELYLSGGRLITVKSGVFNMLPWLRDLRLQGNEIVKIGQGTFDSMSSLDSLQLMENKLTSLDPGIFDTLYKLDRLILSRNPLTTVDANTFTHLDRLNTLHLPLLCNCSSNKLSLMDYVKSNSFVTIVNYTYTDRTTEWLQATEECASIWIDIRECVRPSTSTETVTSATTMQEILSTSGLIVYQTTNSSPTMSTDSTTTDGYKPTERTESTFTTEGKIYSAIAGVIGVATTILTIMAIRRKRIGASAEIHERATDVHQSNLEMVVLEDLAHEVTDPPNRNDRVEECYVAQPPVAHTGDVAYLDREVKKDRNLKEYFV